MEEYIMKTLFIDTHSHNLSIAILDNKKICKIEKKETINHSEVVIPAIQTVLKDANCNVEDINEIVVINGPGSFTGVRIGVTIAKTIAYSLNIPIKTITSLEAYGLSVTKDFDIITISDSKGKYSALKKEKKFIDFSYRKNLEFEKYLKEYNYTSIETEKLDYKKIYAYLQNKSPINPHQVNPIYIKEIDALK